MDLWGVQWWLSLKFLLDRGGEKPIPGFSALGSSELRCESELRLESQPARWLAGRRQLGGPPGEASGLSAASSADPGGVLRETLLWRLPQRGSCLAATYF